MDQIKIGKVIADCRKQKSLTQMQLERKNKTIWNARWVILTVNIVALIVGTVLAKNLIHEGVWQTVAILGIGAVSVIPCFYALKLEVSVGAYKCKNLGHEITPTYRELLFAMHAGTTRHLKCPKCNKRTWCEKVLKKENKK